MPTYRLATFLETDPTHHFLAISSCSRGRSWGEASEAPHPRCKISGATQNLHVTPFTILKQRFVNVRVNSKGP